MDINKRVGKQIRHYRKKRGLTMKEMGDQLYKSIGTISKYESGDISIDLPTLYDVAEVLGVEPEILLVEDEASTQARADERQDSGTVDSAGYVPKFFQNVKKFYMYYFDGRSGDVVSCVAVIGDRVSHNTQRIKLYMNVFNFEFYKDCETPYTGELRHYDALTNIILESEGTEMDHYVASIPAPYIDMPKKWGLAFGISSRPIMPTSTKVLFTKEPMNAEDIKAELKINKDDIKQLRELNMLVMK